MNTNKTIKKDSTIPTPNRAQRKEDLAILKVRNLVISFGSGRKKVKAVKGATFDVYKGETFGLVGESGSGKTTIGRAVMGIQPVSDGTVYFENKVAFGIAPNPYKLNLEVEHNLKMIKLNQNTATLHIETQIQEFKRLFYKYVEGKYYDLKTKEVKDYTDGKNRIIPEGKNLKATKLGNSRKILDLVFIKESVRDNLKRLLKVILIQEQLIKFLDGLSNLIDVDPELNIAIVKYQKRTHKLVLKIKELENEIYLSLERIEKYRSEIKKGVYTSANDFFSNLGQELENIVQKHKQLSVMVATAKKWHHTNIDLTETKFNKRRKRIQKINERIVRNEQRNNVETVKELNEVLKLMELPDIQTAIYNSDRFANPTKKYHHELKKKMQMIFQDPASSLNDRMAVEGIIAEGLENFPELYKNDEAVETYIKWHDEVYPEKAGSVTLKNVNYKHVKKFLIIQLLTTVGMLPEHLSRYPHEFSGGQRQRIGIARALVMKPSFIVADEPISALDVSIRAQVMNLLAQFQREFDLTYVFIAHDLSVVRFVANRIAVIYRGDIVELAEADELFNNPMHPYTKSLLSAVPLPDPKQERMKVHYKYDPEVEHPDYLLDFPKWQEITKGHFVYANDRENKQLIEKYVVAKNKAKK